MKVISSVFLLFIAISVKADIKPVSGAKLNFTQVMLEYDAIDEASEYIIEVSAIYSDGGSSELVKRVTDNSTATLIDNLNYGSNYIWKYAGIVDGKQTEWIGPFEFSVVVDSTIGLDKEHFKVTKYNETEAKKGLIAVGSSKTIIDKSARPVWYLPKINKEIFIEQSNITEFGMTDAGTILFYSSTGFNSGVSLVCETDLTGTILWKAPNDGQVSGDSTEYYHHDFKRLANGNYLVLGCKYGWRKVPANIDVKNIRKINIDSTSNPWRIKYLFNTIIEYNKSGKVVWSWDLNQHVTDKQLFAAGVVTNSVRRELPPRAELYGHMNSIDIDPKGEYIYANFRETNEVIKIRKSTGEIIDRYTGKKGVPQSSKEISFLNQHDVNLLPNGNLMLFDNGDSKADSIPSRAIEFTQNEGNKPGKIVWSFSCKMDTTNNGKTGRFGSVQDIGDGHRLISMGGLNRIVEVDSKDNKVLWDCLFLFRQTKADRGLPLYRVHYTTSLYPCYFTIQWNPKSEKAARSLEIVNEGSSADSYLLKVFSTKGKNEKTVEIGIVEPGKSKTIDPKNLGFSMLEKGDQIIVTSVHNPDFMRKAIYK